VDHCAYGHGQLLNDVLLTLALQRNVRVGEVAWRLDLLEIAGQDGLQYDLAKFDQKVSEKSKKVSFEPDLNQ
jgi:hypothetical protein